MLPSFVSEPTGTPVLEGEGSLEGRLIESELAPHLSGSQPNYVQTLGHRGFLGVLGRNKGNTPLLDRSSTVQKVNTMAHAAARRLTPPGWPEPY